MTADQPKRLDPAFRARLTEFATDRIQAVWNDVGETDAATLAQNIVAAQEFAWMSLHVPVPADQRTADRETIEGALRGAIKAEPNTWRIDSLTTAVLAVLVPADQVRAETLEAWAEFLPTNYTRGLTKRRAAEYRAGLGA